MKKYILLFLITFLFVGISYSQTSIKLNIEHTLGDHDFAANEVAYNNMEQKFDVQRLEYYLSNFKITHDGGQVLELPELYVLVATNDKHVSTIDLGNYDITDIESFSFHTGIDETANHSDPASWPSSHALSPKFPSMHWGWAAGYRFLAIEGKSGNSVNQDMQFHCVGDDFFKEIVFDYVVSASDGEIELPIKADYTQLLKNVDISSGVIVHGGFGDAITVVDNWAQDVFSLYSIVGVSEIELVDFSVFPNPVENMQVNVQLNTEIDNAKIEIFDNIGRLIDLKFVNQSTATINFKLSGLYYISIVDQKGITLGSKKVVVK
ncbi:MAG: MbnP family protein [Saprospiraceae bacterium]